MKPASAAWLGVLVAVVAYEALAATRQEWELMSEAVDRYRRRHPVLVHLAVSYLAGHLTRTWPERLDPLHRLTRRASRGAQI